MMKRKRKEGKKRRKIKEKGNKEKQIKKGKNYDRI